MGNLRFFQPRLQLHIHGEMSGSFAEIERKASRCLEGRPGTSRWRAVVRGRSLHTVLGLPCESANLFAKVGVSRDRGFDVPIFDVGRLYAGPLGAREQGIAGSRSQARRMERATRQEKLRALACLEVGSHGNDLAAAVGVEQENLERVAQVVVVELVGAYAVHNYLGVGSNEEI